MRVFAFASSLALLAPLLTPGCSSTPLSVGLLPDGGTQTEDGGGSCSGTAPLCFGNDVHLCCGNDPEGSAVCRAGQWTCGTAPAPGCNGTSCLAHDAGPADGSTNNGGCGGSAPPCFGYDTQICCEKDPVASAVCEAGQWKCASAPAPGCNGTSCPAEAGPSDGSTSDAGCSGTAPFCYGGGPWTCCSATPIETADCVNGAWMCSVFGSSYVPVPGCNGTTCVEPDAGCAGTAPLCFGSDDSKCCGNDPGGSAKCVSGAWMCGTAVAPGCDGISCLALDGGTD
jgi:hypothetical protein